jgi:HEAT repeat protein
MLKDDDRYVRIHAMMSLGDHLDPSLISLMEGLLRDPDSQIRAMAVQYYAKLNRPGGRPARS